MEFIFLIIGIVIGLILNFISKFMEKTYGFIEIDHDKGLCRFKVTSGELADKKVKKAIFVVKHDGNIPVDQMEDFSTDEFMSWNSSQNKQTL